MSKTNSNERRSNSGGGNSDGASNTIDSDRSPPTDVNFDIFDERRPVKTIREGMRDNPLVVVGIAVMFGIMFRGIWHAVHGRELLSNQFAQYRSFVGIATLGVFGVSAYFREQEWKEELNRRRVARKEYFAHIEAQERAEDQRDLQLQQVTHPLRGDE